MSTYPRHRAMKEPAANTAQAGSQLPPGTPKDAVRVDGFDQVLTMLKIADPEFRESLLKRLSAKDPNLAKQLRSKLK